MVKRNAKDDSVRPYTLPSRDFDQLALCAYHLFILAQTLPSVETDLSGYTLEQQKAMIEKRLALQNLANTLKTTLEKIANPSIPKPIKGGV